MHGAYEETVAAADACADAADRCLSACLLSPDVAHMTGCVAHGLETAQICRLLAGFASRGSVFAGRLAAVASALATACAAECDRHDHEACRSCAEACRACVAACDRLVALHDAAPGGAPADPPPSDATAAAPASATA